MILYLPFDTIPAYDTQTDKQTGRHNGMHCVSIAWRGKNVAVESNGQFFSENESIQVE